MKYSLRKKLGLSLISILLFSAVTVTLLFSGAHGIPTIQGNFLRQPIPLRKFELSDLLNQSFTDFEVFTFPFSSIS